MVAVLQPVTEGKLIAIDRAVILVGRGADCDVVLTVSPKISRRHCCLVQVDETYFVRDLGSLNGVWLNGARVNREILMQTGDRVAIGDVEFVFHPNARVEAKKNVSAMPDEISPLPVAHVDGREQLKQSVLGKASVNNVVPDSGADAIPIVEAVDDVIPLAEEVLADDEETLKETNEIEAIDEPVYDLDYRDDDAGDSDELIIFDDE
mgnify:CR=1 FL=1